MRSFRSWPHTSGGRTSPHPPSMLRSPCDVENPTLHRARRASGKSALRHLGLLCVGLLLVPLVSTADLLLTTETRDISAGPDAGLGSRIWLAEDRIRMEFAGTGAGGRRATVIYRADRSVYWVLDDSSRSYIQIDRETINKLGQRVREARHEMTAQLETMSPQQRTQAEAMLSQMLPPEEAPKRETLRATPEHKRIDEYDAQRSELLLDGRVVGDVFLVPLEALALKPEQLQVFAHLSAFQRELFLILGQSAQAAFSNAPFEIFERTDGFPLLMRRLHEGNVESLTRFSKPKSVPNDAGRYVPPDGYTRRLGPGLPAPPG
jgi:hypothetical protein